MHTLILIGSCITALTVIVTAAVKMFRVANKANKWIETQERHTRENYLDIKRLIITSPYMPLGERISAGEKYIAEGGNGEVKHLYQDLLEKLD